MAEQGLTRRRILQVLGSAAAAATLEPLRDLRASAASVVTPGATAPPAALHPVALGAQPFSLTAVRLLAPLEGALRALWFALVLLAAGLVVLRA